MTITNPLLLQNPIESVDQIAPEHVDPAISLILQENKAVIESIVSHVEKSPEKLSWNQLMMPLELLDDRLSKAWSPVSHLNSVCNSKALRTAYDSAIALLTDYSTELGQHQGLFNATSKLYEAREKLALSNSQCQILKDSLIAFKLSGLHLSGPEQAEFSQIQKRLAELSSKYEQNILDSTMAWTKLVDDVTQLKGLPETELAMLKENAESRKQSGYLITLEIPSYIAIMTYADSRELRKEVYTAYITRASENASDPQYDNSQIMVELLELKHKKANLLGFNNYAELSLESKMAESPEQVMQFLQDLNVQARQQAKEEFNRLAEFSKQYGVEALESWDVGYFSEKLKEQSYQISQSELRDYFSVDRVIDGLFDITQHHFGVTFKAVNKTATWHSDVKHFCILRDEQVIAEFYLDLYARQHKRGGAWMDHYQSRFKLSAKKVQHPIAFLTCNFAPPVEGNPALLTHDEVVTLFHEFGHGLHHMLTKVDELSASGIANVPWDAVELPSQFMENFCYHPEVLKSLSEHYKTAESLPQAMLEKLIEAKNFQSAMSMVRQIEFALFDMRIHCSAPLNIEQIQAVLDQTREQVAVAIPPKFNRFQHGFSHIFAGGYSAGYYSYKWAEVLSADAFSMFEEQGVMNPAMGQQFLTKILEKGGSEEPMKLFENFRGRKPTVDALLKHSGIK